MDRDDQAVALAAAELLRAESWTSHPDGVRCRGRLARRLGGLLNSRGATTPAWLYDTEEATELLEQVAAAGRRDVGSGEVVDLLAVATLDEPIRFMQTCDHGLWAVCVSPPIAAFVGGVTRGQISSAPAESEG